MARPDFDSSLCNKANWNYVTPVAWNNSGGDWWSNDASAQGAIGALSWGTATQTTTGSFTVDVTSLFQAIYDNTNHACAVIIRGSASSNILIAGKTNSTAGNRPAISYDGGAYQECTDTAGLSNPSSGADTSAEMYVSEDAGGLGFYRMLVELPAPVSRPTSATLRLNNSWVGGGTQTIYVDWLRYPTESAPTLGGPPTAPSGVTVGSVSYSSASVSWTDNSSDETGFKVETSPSPYSSWTAASGSPATSSPLVVTGLSPSTTYKARVAATNANGDSAWVESSTFTTTSALAGRALLLGVG